MRPIDGDLLIERLESAKAGRGVAVDLVYSLIIEGVRHLPILTLEDLRDKGEWRHRKNGVAYCTACLTEAVEDSTDFCPSCGANMRGGDPDA